MTHDFTGLMIGVPVARDIAQRHDRDFAEFAAQNNTTGEYCDGTAFTKWMKIGIVGGERIASFDLESPIILPTEKEIDKMLENI